MSANQILSGFHAVKARLKHAPGSFKEVYVDSSRQDARMQNLIQQLDREQIRWIGADNKRLDKLSHGLKHQGVIAFVKNRPLAVSVDELLDTLEEAQQIPLLLILDGVTDPHNLGACLRTADAAGVHAVIAPKDRAVGLNATVHRVACGAADTVPYITVTNLARTMRGLKQRDIHLIGTSDKSSQTIHDIDASQAMAWVMGAEGDGMRRLTTETCDELVSIPMLGAVESLNVSVASAICLYETVRQRKT